MSGGANSGDDATGAQKRSAIRWRYRDFVVFRSKTWSGEGLLGNVSSGGVFVRTSRPPALGEPIRLVLQGTTPALSLDAEVCWVGRRRDGSPGFGCRLVEAPRPYLDIVRSLAAIGSIDSGHKRISARIELSIPVGIELENACDEGVLCDISLGGARLRGTSIHPSPGSDVVVTFAVPGQRRPFEVLARVIRATPDGGYAVEFEAIDPRLKAAFEYVHAIVRKLPEI